MKTLQFRQAIAEAMSEEMRRDDTIYLMGEEVAEYNGAYKASKGILPFRSWASQELVFVLP